VAQEPARSPDTKRGRPPRDIVDLLRGRAWFAAVQFKATELSAYALEKLFAFSAVEHHKPWQPTGSWRAYALGTRIPGPAVVEKVEQAYSGTRIWLELTLWELMRVPGPTLGRVRFLMTQLRPDITNLLFIPVGASGEFDRRRTTADTFSALDRMGDIEALTACMALIREAEHRGDEYQHIRAAMLGLRIFLRLAGSLPLLTTADAILRYLNYCFFSADYVYVTRKGPAAGGVDLHMELDVRSAIFLMLEDFGVLDPHPSHRRACLYLADVYGIPKAFHELRIACDTGSMKKPSWPPVVKWFARRLRSFELTVSCLDWPRVSPPLTGASARSKLDA
jgi:hypothetical protein